MEQEYKQSQTNQGQVSWYRGGGLKYNNKFGQN